MGKCILFGEPMALLIADEVGPLEQVEHFTRAMSGAEVNVSIGLTRLGHSVEYLTRLGDDPFGHYIANALQDAGIGTSLISFDPVYRTGIQLKNRVTDGSDPCAPYYRKGSAASHISKKEIDEIDLDGVDLIHVTGIPPALSQTARVVLPGIAECETLAGTADLEEAADFYHRLGVRTVVIKDGSKGAFISMEGEPSCHVEGFHVEKVVDTVGAGDGFAVGVLSGLLEGLPLKDSVRRGNAIGAIQVTSISDNAALPERDALQAFMMK